MGDDGSFTANVFDYFIANEHMHHQSLEPLLFMDCESILGLAETLEIDALHQ